MTGYSLQVGYNPYLAPGERDVHAIVTVRVDGPAPGVSLLIRTTKHAEVQFLRQVSPTRRELPAGDPELGPWQGPESRDYHLALRMSPGTIGQERLGARLLLESEQGVTVATAQVAVTWTEDVSHTVTIHPLVARYTGRVLLAEAITEALDARSVGLTEMATTGLRRAVLLADELGDGDTARLVRRVMEGTIPVKVYLSTERGHEAVTEALNSVLEEYGLPIRSSHAPEPGSWFREFWASSRDSVNPDDVSDKLVTSLAPIQKALVQIGSILVIKVDDVVLVRNLSQRELAHFQRNPALFRDPALALDHLQREAAEG